MTIRRIACGRTMFVPYLSAGRLYRVSPQLLVRSFPPSTSVPFSLPAVSYAHIESIVQRILSSTSRLLAGNFGIYSLHFFYLAWPSNLILLEYRCEGAT
jgi:hypothetical protein